MKWRGNSSTQKRRGVVLLAVLVVLVLLSLAAYQYTDLMIAESASSENYHRVARVRALAESGVHYTAALLSNPENFLSENMLDSNPYDNERMFKGIPIKGADGTEIGFFSVIAPVDPEDDNGGSVRYGVSDETGKININAVMKRDPTGDQLFEMLKKLPNMEEDFAAAIVDWVDDNTDVYGQGKGAEDYSGSGYRAKNGPLDNIQELLLVRGVTEYLLYGDDRNRNGVQDAGEGSGGAFDRGWSAYLTIHSREQTLNTLDIPLLYVNQEDLETLYTTLVDQQMDPDLAKFIVLYRQRGPASKSGGSQSIGRTIASLFMPKGKSSSSSNTQQTIQGNLSDYEPEFETIAKRPIRSLFDLVDVEVEVPGKSGSPKVRYASPLNDKTRRGDLLPQLFEQLTIFEETDIPARININTAPREVLAAMPALTPADVEAILDKRPRYSSQSAPPTNYQTLAWLMTELDLKAATLKEIEKVATTRSQVFKLQVLGYEAEGKGPAARVEAVIDTNGGRPRIIGFRDLSDMGRTSVK